jgi:thymidylate kinase
MLVVVEGVDGSGKSTLVQTLRKQPGQYCMIIQASRPRGIGDLENFFDATASLKNQIDGTVICDRFHPISECVYGSVLRGRSTPLSEVVKYLIHVDLIIYCRSSLETIRVNLPKSPQMLGVFENLVKLTEAYDLLMRHLRLVRPIIEYDYTTNSISEVTKIIYGN